MSLLRRLLPTVARGVSRTKPEELGPGILLKILSLQIRSSSCSQLLERMFIPEGQRVILAKTMMVGSAVHEVHLWSQQQLIQGKECVSRSGNPEQISHCPPEVQV